MKLHQTLALSLSALAAVSLLGMRVASASASTAPTTAGSNYSCPDDGSKDLDLGNVDPSVAHKVQLKPANTSDKEFQVIVYKNVWNPKTEMWELKPQRPVNYKPGSTPVFTVPPFGKATVVDGPNDPGSKKPSGSMTVS